MTPNENPSYKTGSAVTTEALVTVLTPLSTAIVEIGRFKSNGEVSSCSSSVLSILMVTGGSRSDLDKSVRS